MGEEYRLLKTESAENGKADKDLFNIEELIRSEHIATRWQPICSIKKRSIVGFEALSFGMAADGQPIAPMDLFSAAAEKRLTLALDRLCRIKAIENFRAIDEQYRETTLFMNLDTSIIDRGVVGSGHLSKAVERVGLDPRQIVVEIIESRTSNLRALREFIETYRDNGFLIALDDVGAGHSNLDRIAQLKPDLLKIDRDLVEHLHEYHSREVFRAITGLAHATGALVVAEGMETEEQALLSLELGADLLQGYYLARPQPVNEALIDSLKKRTARLATSFRNQLMRNMQTQSDRYARFMAVQADILQQVKHTPVDSFDTTLSKTITAHSSIEFAYILSCDGVQVSSTIGDGNRSFAAKHFLFEPAEPGTDHGLKEYVLLLNAGTDHCLTDPYISLASGGLCQTLATRFNGADEHNYILCLDFAAPEN
jgi:EAL domain-containing protein (putative c-di-GMP-specific phosphodiesterase class I)